MICFIDNINNDLELVSEKQNPCCNTDEISSDLINFDRSMKSSVNDETSSSFNEKSNDQSIIKITQLTQNDITDHHLNLVKEESHQKNISKDAKELESSNAIESISNDCNSNEVLIEGKKLSDFTNVAEKIIVDLLSDLFEKESVKRDIKYSIDETSDDLRMKNNSRLEKIQKNQEILNVNSNSENDINHSFSDILVDEQKQQNEKTAKKNNNGNSEIDENNEEDCSLQSMEKEEDNETECDLILVDKQAWLAAERMKVAKEAESSEYDSDDTMIKKCKLDAERANSDNKILNIIKEEILIDEEIDVFPTEIKLYKTPEKKSEKEINSSIVCTENYVNSNSTDKSSDDTEISNSDQNNDCPVYKLNKSEQIRKVTRRLSETHHESDEDKNDDTDKNSRTNKANISQRKSLQERKSLNKSSKNTSLKQNDNNTQDFFMNEYQTNDTLQKESDRMEISRERSLSSKDDNKIEEQSCLDRSEEKSKVITKLSTKLINISDEESNDSETAIQVMDLESQNYSTIAHAGSLDGETSDSIIVPSYLFTDDDNNDNDNNTDKNSDNDNDFHNTDSDIDSDIKKEYNLDGMEQKFDDDNVPHDKCRASESEYSDPNDNGSDLADFIVDDDEVETEEDSDAQSNPNVSNEYVKPHVIQNENEKISSESPSSTKIKRKSLLQNSEKIETEQDSPKQLDESTSQFSKKLKLHTSMKCSTPKLNSSKHVLELNIETSKILEKAQESKNKLDDKNKTMQNTSSKKIKLKNSTMKRDTSLTDISHQDKYFVEKPVNISLPSNLMETVEKANHSKPIISKISELHKTINISHTETPTIRALRKEKLNESAPASKLYPEIDQSKELSLTIEEKGNIAEIKVKNNEDINLEPSNDNIMQERKRQKKRKKQADETLKENIIDKTLSEDNTDLQSLQKKKRVKLNESLNTQDDICKDTLQINEERKKRKERKKKKKQVDINKQDEYIKKADIDQNNRNETVLVEHKKNKKTEITSSSESNTSKNDHTNKEKKSERKEQEIIQSEETLPEKSSKKRRKKKQKKEKKPAPLEIKVSKENSKNSNLHKPSSQITGCTIQKTTESNSIIVKMRRELEEAILGAEMRIKAKKNKMQENIIEKENQKRALQIQNLQEQNIKSLNKKRKKKTSENRAIPSSSSNLKRLPDDVIKNLPESSRPPLPKTAKKRQLEEAQNEKPIALPPSKRSKSMNAKNSIVLSTSGGTTQFAVINIQKLKDQLPKTSNVATSFRERMLNRNKREPISAYLMYLEKQRASSNKGSKLF